MNYTLTKQEYNQLFILLLNTKASGALMAVIEAITSAIRDAVIEKGEVEELEFDFSILEVYSMFEAIKLVLTKEINVADISALRNIAKSIKCSKKLEDELIKIKQIDIGSFSIDE